MYRYKAVVKLHFTKDALNHTAKYTVWGDTMEELDFHIDVEIADMESAGWELENETVLSVKKYWQGKEV